MDYTQQTLANGVTLHLLPMENYKTTFIGAFLYWPLGDDAAKTAIVPHLLQRGTVTYPTARELRAHLAELYGTQFGIGVLKRGENLVLQVRIQLVNDQAFPQHLLSWRRPWISFGKFCFTLTRNKASSPQAMFRAKSATSSPG